MRTCHWVSWLLTGFACSVICADGDIQSGRDVTDKMEDVVGGNVAQVGDLASVSLPMQSLSVPQSEGVETMKRTLLTS